MCLYVWMANKPDAALLEALGAVPLFRECTPRELKAVAQGGKLLSKRAGSKIVEEGSGGVAFFLILEGVVDVSRDGTPLASLAPGQFFGENALLVDGARNATAAAATDAKLFVFTQWAFKSMLLSNAKISYAVAKAVAERSAG